MADAFGCGINDLPLTLVLSWYEQKAVCILLTLLALSAIPKYIRIADSAAQHAKTAIPFGRAASQNQDIALSDIVRGYVKLFFSV